MRSRLATAALCAAAVPCAAVADTITQVVPFDYDASFGVSFPVVQGFDTLGGSRQLTSVTFEFRNNFDIELFVESTGPTAVSAGDFSLDLSYITLYQLGLGSDEPPPPVFGPGALFVGAITGALTAYDGVPGSDGPDSFRRSIAESFTAAQVYTEAEPEVLAALTDVGPLTTVYGGFSELFFAWISDPNWPPPPLGVPEYPGDAAIWVSTPTFRHFGEIAVTYEFVPEPATASLIGAGALLIRRRQRH